MAVILSVLTVFRCGLTGLKEALRVFRKNPIFWTISGIIGHGLFYASLCYSYTFVSGWVVAVGCQTTLFFGLIVLRCFGERLSRRSIAFSILVFCGVVIVFFAQDGIVISTNSIIPFVSICIAAATYPIGTQLVGRAHLGGHGLIPHITDPITTHASVRVLLMSIGSFVIWIPLGVFLALKNQLPTPDASQYVQVLIVALCAGVGATTLFLKAHNSTKNPYYIAAVDASLSTEIIFTILGEWILLSLVIPSPIEWMGMSIVLTGIVCYALFSPK